MTSPSPADELVERLLSELKDIRASAQLRLTRLIEADDKIESLSAQLAEAMEALELYANDANWKLGGPCDPNSSNFAGTSFARRLVEGGQNG